MADDTITTTELAEPSRKRPRLSETKKTPKTAPASTTINNSTNATTQEEKAPESSNQIDKKKKPRKKHVPKRNLEVKAPMLHQLYQQLRANTEQQASIEQERITCQQLLQQVQVRLETAHRQTAALANELAQLEHHIETKELELDNDFTRHYRQLVQFQRQRGHCHVPKERTALHAWAKKMRRIQTHYRAGTLYQSGPWKYYLRALDRVGFVWDAVKDQWRLQFEKMVHYKLETGHCCVPKQYPPDKKLGAWVHRQRYHYKLYHEGKPTQLTPERIELLNSVGFSWTGNLQGGPPCATSTVPVPTKPRRGTQKRTAEEEWEHHFRALLEFKQKYGHVKISSIPDKDRNNQLRDWIAWQRREYKRWKQGEPSHVTSEHVRRLQEIGFSWEIRPGPKKKNGDCTNDIINNIFNNNRIDNHTPPLNQNDPPRPNHYRVAMGGNHNHNSTARTMSPLTMRDDLGNLPTLAAVLEQQIMPDITETAAAEVMGMLQCGAVERAEHNNNKTDDDNMDYLNESQD